MFKLLGIIKEKVKRIESIKGNEIERHVRIPTKGIYIKD